MKNENGSRNSASEDIALRDAVEAALDEKYHQLALPHPNRTLATWYLLTVSEDYQHGLFCHIGGQAKGATIEYQIDRLKYSLRYGLERIYKETKDFSMARVPRRIVPKLYSKTSKLMFGGLEYIEANQFCAAAHAGTLCFREDKGDIKVVYDERYHDKRYAVLELMGHQEPDAVDFAALLYMWIRNEDDRLPEVVRRIADTVREKEKLLEYEYDPTLAYQLAKKMPQQPFLIPDGWTFPWGGRYETTLLLNSLSVRCMYHLVAVHFGAERNMLRGGGHSNICLVIDRSNLVENIALLSSLSHGSIGKFVEFVTYGKRTRTPDPALQPLVLLGGKRFALPCIHFLSSHLERNLLSLQARVNKVEFDALSDLFEVEMVSRQKANLSKRWPLVRSNVELTINGATEEIDLLVADLKSKTLLVCELRWMLPPGDPREVQNRKRVCYQKVDQLERKVLWAQTHALELFRRAFQNESKVDERECWNAVGVVVIENFGGVRSRKAEYPILTAALFELGMQKTTSLKHFGEWSKSLKWLPQEGSQFEIRTRKIEFAQDTIECPAIERLQSRHEYRDFVSSTVT